MTFSTNRRHKYGCFKNHYPCLFQVLSPLFLLELENSFHGSISHHIFIYPPQRVISAKLFKDYGAPFANVFLNVLMKGTHFRAS